ncbi:MAG: glycosyltransferase [uncultured bacterium]|nr:MAG: glycosyltransferase [uncultured bacterium]HBR71543.1 hypothetical protein [Candidatus Moranbacteria bacterium]
MKKILFTLYKNRSHSLYKEFIDNPPEGYQYFTLDDFFDYFIFDKPANLFLDIKRKIERDKKIIEAAKKNGIDIIYCSDGLFFLNSPIPWVMDLEHVTGLISNCYKLWKIGKLIMPIILSQKNLKYIIPWTKTGANVLEDNFKINDSVRKKIKPINLCLKKIYDYGYIEKKKIKGVKFSIIFVTSVNYNGEDEFYAKGGAIIAEVFKKINTKVDIRLILRSKIPKEFDYLKKDPSVEVYEETLNDDEFQNLFLGADLFFYPGYQSPGMAFLDAMNYNLPIVSTRVFANPEMVRDGWNGFLVDFPISSIAFYLTEEFNIKGVPSGIRAREDKLSEKMIDDFAEKIIQLQKNREVLEEMGVNSKKLLLNSFSLAKRNRALEDIFNEIINTNKKI